MIAGIIQTIIMALGIATGNISSNAYKGGNVFNDENKSQKTEVKKAIEEVNLLQISKYYQAQTIGSHESNCVEKYYITNNDSRNQATPNFYNAYMNCYNTIYTSTRNYGNFIDIKILTILKIDNYFRSTSNVITYKDIQKLKSNDNSLQLTYGTQFRIYETNALDQYIDVTLTSTDSVNNLETSILATQGYTVLQGNNGTLQNQGGLLYTTYRLEQAFNINELPYHSNYTLLLYDYIYASTSNVTNIFPIYDDNDNIAVNSGITLRGFIDNTPVNYEVVDIPGLMFTVLTMPFSFISSAFNLTIFPGTPYQVNFANLLMVLLATFILAWIIKKVFH